MNETKRIENLFQQLYTGDPWIDVNLVSTLKPLQAQQAAARPFPDCNTILEILNHVISWRLTVLARIKRKIIATPDNNYMEPIIDSSEEAWAATLERLEFTQAEWVAFLNKCTESDLDHTYGSGEMTQYEVIHGIIQHDAYHLGQLSLLAKQFK